MNDRTSSEPTPRDRIDDALSELQKSIALLRAIDRSCVVFGATSHEYALAAPMSRADLEAKERALGAVLPDEHRAFLVSIGAAGAGPYYGLSELPDREEAIAARLDAPFVGDAEDEEMPRDPARRGGALVLAEQGCGYRSVLVLHGPKRGQVWADMREAHEGFVFEAPSFVDWYRAWVDKALVEWAIAELPRLDPRAERDVPVGVALERVGPIVERLLDRAAPRPTWEALYPIAESSLVSALVHLRVLQEKYADARALVPRLRAASKEPEARGALALARIARAEGDEIAALAFAEEGLAAPGLWFATKTELLVEKEWALGLAGRHRDRIATILARAEHTRERYAYFDAAFAQLEEDDRAGAAETLMRAAGAEGDVPTRAQKALEMGEELFAAVADSELAERGNLLRADLEALAGAS